ncbi:hypothetical protein ACHAW5_003425 [Stephanodiscus triporus]|uniref:Uncharacterized protein n=1 Tax=Stephanodiscus triporus TaxID=2934178 RepID=A0ABD3PA50_9STRA
MILPYFGGAEGEACRVAAVDAWRAQNSTLKAELDAVMETDLYQIAKSHCQPQIELYNVASGVTCLIEKSTKGQYNLTYGGFWDDGGIYFDGDYDLATMFSQTSNFTEAGDGTPCISDCYTGTGLGCLYLKPWITNYGKITTEQYCQEAWGGIDTGYNMIKLCAAKAIGAPSNMTQLEYINIFRYQLSTQQECDYKKCFPDLDDGILSTSCPNVTGNGSVTASGGFMHDLVFDFKTSAVVLLFVAWLA